MLKKNDKYSMSALWHCVALLCMALLTSSCQLSAPEVTPADDAATSVVTENFIAPVLFNTDWEFSASDQDRSWQAIAVEKSWQKVSLPHSARMEPKIVNNQWQGFAWYRKKLQPNPAWNGKQVYVDFEAAMNAAEVWLNGKKLSAHLGGYLPFSVQLPLLNAGDDNWLYVKLDNRDSAVTGPKPLKLLDFNTYGGIYRNVWLRAENTTHISDAVAANKVASGGVFVSYPQVSASAAQVQVKTHVLTGATTAGVQLTQNLYWGEQLVGSVQSELVAPSTALNGKASLEVELEATQQLNLLRPHLWSPAAPNLYRLETLVFEGGKLVDKEINKIGVREFKFVDNRLYINGKQSFLRGVNRHQEYPYVGYALSDAAQYRDAEKIKAAGFDYVRLSHYPHAKAFMNAADELGLVLLDSILGWQYVNETPEFTAQVLQTCRDLIRRDRNHASVLAWECSLNESWMQESLIDQFTQIVHEEYPGANVYSAGWQEYGYDIFLQARQHRLEHYKKPTKPYVVSEYGDWEYYAMNAGLQQDSWQNLLQADRSSRQLLSDGEKRLQQQARNIAEAHNDNFNTPAFADGFWVMFDYNRGYADDLESSGIMSIDRLPKFSYYFYQSQRDANDYAGPLVGNKKVSEKTADSIKANTENRQQNNSGYMVFMATHWQANSALSFPIYTNAERVEIYLNGKLLGESVLESNLGNLPHPPHHFTLPAFATGELKAVAYAKGKPVAEQRVQTPGAPAKLVLSVDASSIPPQAGRNDVVFVRAMLQDAAGHNARINSEPVSFALTGDAELLSPVQVNTEDGIASALVRLGSDLRGVKISAHYKNIHAQTLSLANE